MSEDDVSSLQSMDSRLGNIARTQGIKFVVSLVSGVAVVATAWATINNRLNDMDSYGPKSFQSYVQDRAKEDRHRDRLLEQIAYKLGIKTDEH